MLTDLITRPCTLIRRSEDGTTDELGNEVPAETLVEALWEVQQRTRREPGAEGEVSDTLWDAFFPTGTALDTGDAVIDDELGEFELVGDPWPAKLGSSGMAHVEATVRKVHGAEDAS